MSQCILGVQIAITSGCAVFHDGKIVYASSEERFTKVKNEGIFPFQAIDSAMDFLKEKNLPRPVKAVIVSENMDYKHYQMRRECTYSVKDYLKEQKEYYYPAIYENRKVEYETIFPEKFNNDNLSNEQVGRIEQAENEHDEFKKIRMEILREHTGISDIGCMNHEHSHAAYGYYASPYRDDDVAVVTIDGFGDNANASVWTPVQGKLHCHKKYTNFNIGRLYRYMTLLLGMKPNEHEFKVMGLAPYADERYMKEAFKVFDGTWYFDKSDGEIKAHTKPEDHYFYFREKLEGMRFDSIAGALQKYCEKMILDLVEYWCEKLEKRKVILSGGVSLNIKANQVVSQSELIDDIFVPASAGDESQCIGGLMAYLEINNLPVQPMTNMYLGNSYSQQTINSKVSSFIEKNSDFRVEFNCTNKQVASHLANGKVVARYCGRMEFGARALGNRSILGNPAVSDIVKKINSQIKHRDFWMPFTPSIIDCKAQDYLINPKKINYPFMTIACDTSEEARQNIAGALHPADYTARPQIVTREMNENYWDLLNEFYELTGIGALLNTSFNLSGLPICESPEDVFNVLLNSDLDMALLGTTLLYRKKGE